MFVHVYVCWADLFSPQSSSHSVLSQQVYASRDAMMGAGAFYCFSLYVWILSLSGIACLRDGGLNAYDAAWHKTFPSQRSLCVVACHC
jgi:hypothetical protein